MPFPERCPEGAIAVVTDVHPDEWTSEPAYDVYRELDERKLPGVWPIRANLLTWERNRRDGTNHRFTDINMQTIDAEYAAQNPGAYEVGRKREVEEAVAPARLVIHLHGSNGAPGSYAWYNANASDEVRGIVSAAGMRRAVHFAPYNIGYGTPHHVIFDHARCDMRTYVPTVYGLLAKIAVGAVFQATAISEYVWAADVKAADAARVGLPDFHPAWEPFPPDDQKKLGALGLPPNGVSTNWNRRLYAHTGYIAELLVPTTTDKPTASDNLL